MSNDTGLTTCRWSAAPVVTVVRLPVAGRRIAAVARTAQPRRRDPDLGLANWEANVLPTETANPLRAAVSEFGRLDAHAWPVTDVPAGPPHLAAERRSRSDSDKTAV
jgi:hypothetical protein